MVMVAWLFEYSIYHQITHFKTMNFMVCELYIKKIQREVDRNLFDHVDTKIISDIFIFI